MLGAAKIFLWNFFKILDSIWRQTEGTWHEAVVRSTGAEIRPQSFLLCAPEGWTLGTLSMGFFAFSQWKAPEGHPRAEGEWGWVSIPQHPFCGVFEPNNTSLPKSIDPFRQSSPYSFESRNYSVPPAPQF